MRNTREMLAPSVERRLAATVGRLGGESAFEVMARAKELERQGRSVVHLEIGEPDFDTPEHVKRAATEAMECGWTHYVPSAGIHELRETIARHLSRTRNVSLEAENVIVGPGGKPVIWCILSALLDPGDELIYADPAYPAYASAAGYLGAKAVPVPLLESRDFRLDLDVLAAKIGPRTKAIVINSPHNPTGGVLTREDLERIAELAQRHDLLVISDEIYSRNIYGSQFLSISSLPGMLERTIIVDGFSKAYAMTGWRLGYAALPKEIARAVTLFLNNTVSCTTAFVQMAGIAALTGPDDAVTRMNEEFRRRRDVLIAGLNAIPGLSCVMPQGAFYAFPNVSRVARDEKRLARFLLEEAGVATLAGTAFGAAGKGYIRLSYANSIENLQLALTRIGEALPKYKDETA
ncbi:pyridoxal phosphate-dependent aminotransferase [bacterium]|nr:MAG: pyridoxal phosphate-dependent aminotransferase [bacterium]